MKGKVYIWLIPLLVGANVISALAVVFSTYETRVLFGELQSLERQHEELKIEYGQLLLEESAWSSPGLIEQKAKNELGLSAPKESNIKVIQINKGH